MGDLRPTLEKLGLQAYTDRFISEGFDSWDTLSRITESDLYVLSSPQVLTICHVATSR